LIHSIIHLFFSLFSAVSLPISQALNFGADAEEKGKKYESIIIFLVN